VAARWLVGGVMAYAGVVKIRALDVFYLDLVSYRMFPEWLMRLAVYGVPAAEVVLGLALVGRATSRQAGQAIAGLLVLFIGVLAIAGVRGVDIRCGCFGGTGIGSGANFIVWLILRDGLLLGVLSWGMGWTKTWRTGESRGQG
jgi:hypothetical protein